MLPNFDDSRKKHFRVSTELGKNLIILQIFMNSRIIIAITKC